MITGYKETLDAIYLYVDFSYEFAKLVTDGRHNVKFLTKVKEYFERLKVDYRHKKIILVSSGIIVGTLLLGGVIGSSINEQIFLNSTNQKENTIINEGIIHPILKDEYEIVDVPVVNNPSINKPAISKPTIKDPIQEEIKKPIVKPPQGEVVTPPKEEVKPPVVDKPVINEVYVTVVRSSGAIERILLEDYLVGVVSSEMPVLFNSEALKAQAVAARTYALKRTSQGKVLTDTTSTQVYKDNSQLKILWGSNYDKYYQKVKAAVLATKGQTIKYNGFYIDAVYHSMSNGYTEDAKNVWGNSIPYLKSVASHWDLSVKNNVMTVSKPLATVANILGVEPSNINQIVLKNASNRVDEIIFEDSRFAGIAIRTLFGLRSSDFTVSVIDDEVFFTTKGYGHGVGMSQYGANEMAKEGYTYKQILNHYYTGVQIA